MRRQHLHSLAERPGHIEREVCNRTVEHGRPRFKDLSASTIGRGQGAGVGSFVYQHIFPEPFVDILKRCISKELAEGLWPSLKAKSCV
jgi:hypothetical protein